MVNLKSTPRWTGAFQPSGGRYGVVHVARLGSNEAAPAPHERQFLLMADVEAALDAAGLTNPAVREYVRKYADLTGAERVEVVSPADDARLIEEA